MRRWAMAAGDLAGLAPVRDPHIRIVKFEHDIAEFLSARTAADFPAAPAAQPSTLITFARSGGRRTPLLVDGTTVRLLELSDGARTAGEIVQLLNCENGGSGIDDNLQWIENLFRHGLVQLQEERLEPVVETVPFGANPHQSIESGPKSGVDR
jgi:hypothetical protein